MAALLRTAVHCRLGRLLDSNPGLQFYNLVSLPMSHHCSHNEPPLLPHEPPLLPQEPPLLYNIFIINRDIAIYSKLQQYLKNHQNMLHGNGLNLVKKCPISVFFTLFRIYMKNATIFI
jgi:hypothetical protein